MNTTTRSPSAVYIGMGANMGDRLANLRAALRLMAGSTTVEAVSSLYETPPFGVTDQPSFYNAVCRITTDLDPHALLRRLKQIEHDIGRRPGQRWGPRPIDLDILLYGDTVVDTPDLTIPHIGIPERAFVLVPLAELAADLRHPTLGKTVAELLDAVDQTGVTQIAGSDWAI
jgi:2-amino-4-hydroxy-6-hydroxymethyldihydropteridine diphosphokinase